MFGWEWKSEGMKIVSLYKFTKTSLLKNDDQLKQKSDKQPHIKIKKNKKNKKQSPNLLKNKNHFPKKKSCLVKQKTHTKKKKKAKQKKKRRKTK